MYNKFYPNFKVGPTGHTTKILLVMTLMLCLLVGVILQASASSNVAISKKNYHIVDSTRRVTISGRIFEAIDPPLPLGATIAVQGLSIGTVTDAHGFFKLINVPVHSTLLISCTHDLSNLSILKQFNKSITQKTSYKFVFL